MGELKNEEDHQLGGNHTFPPKRKLNEEEDVLINSDSVSKKPKPEALLETKLIETEVNEEHIEEDDEEEEEEEYEGEDEEEDDDDDDDVEEHSNGEAEAEAEVDVKGKGVMKEDKGKGKLIEESEDDSSDEDADAVGSGDDSDSDLSEDPLAEVDLDNILPSRTRSRRGASRGVFIGNSHDKDNDDEE